MSWIDQRILIPTSSIRDSLQLNFDTNSRERIFFKNNHETSVTRYKYKNLLRTWPSPIDLTPTQTTSTILNPWFGKVALLRWSNAEVDTFVEGIQGIHLRTWEMNVEPWKGTNFEKEAFQPASNPSIFRGSVSFWGSRKVVPGVFVLFRELSWTWAMATKLIRNKVVVIYGYLTRPCKTRWKIHLWSSSLLTSNTSFDIKLQVAVNPYVSIQS